MGYRVRSADGGGELRFQSLYEIERMLAQGLVSPDDELTEDGPGEAWRKVSEVPALKATRPPRPPSSWRSSPFVWVVPLCALLLATLVLLFSPRYWIAGLALALFATLLLGQLTYKVFTRRQVR
jgi:hypothetical protein